MTHKRTFTLPELIELGVEAYHVADNGVWWLFHGCWALRCDSLRGTRTLVMDAAALPVGPWHATAWGEMELERGAQGEAADGEPCDEPIRGIDGGGGAP